MGEEGLERGFAGVLDRSHQCREPGRAGAPALQNRREKETSMAKAAQMEKPRGNKPQYVVRAKQAPDSEFMQTIGAAWPFNEGDGFVVKLHSLPINWTGDMILVPPKSDE
jgi:hypothetical protein